MTHYLPPVSVCIGGAVDSEIDIWLLPGFGKSQRCWWRAFNEPIARFARLLTFDLPGFGSTPAHADGLTVYDCACVWGTLVDSISRSRRFVLVAHSMAGIIAAETAQLLDRLPLLVVSVEGNLTAADAYYSGQAAEYVDSATFYSAFLANMGELARERKIPTGYFECLRVADPHTLWTLGRSVASYSEPGRAFATLPCPKVYYWNEGSMPLESRRFLAQSELMQRQFAGVGHWPMLTSPVSFYAALEADIVSAM